MNDQTPPADDVHSSSPALADDLPTPNTADPYATVGPTAANAVVPKSGIIAGYEILEELGRGGMGAAEAEATADAIAE